SSRVLTGNNTYSGPTTLTGGVLSVSTIGNGLVAGNLGAASNAASNLVFAAAATNNPAVLQYTGADASTDRNFTINAGTTAVFDITAHNLTFTGAATAASSGALSKTGIGTLTLAGAANGYTGATNLYAGKMLLDFSAATAPASQMISASSNLNFGPNSPRGAQMFGSQTLTIQGANSATTTVQNFNVLTIGNMGGSANAAHLNLVDGTGGNTISVNFASLAAFQGWNRSGDTLDIKKSAGDSVKFTTAPAVAYGLIDPNTGSYPAITLNGTDWANYDNTLGVVAATYTNTANPGDGGTNYNITGSGNLNGAHTLRFDSASASTLTALSADRGVGGILVTPNVGANPIVITGNSITPGYILGVFQNNTAGDLTIASGISDRWNSSAHLTKAGAGRLILSGTNTYGSATQVTEGTLQITSNANLGGVGYYANSYNPVLGDLVLNATLEVRGGTTVSLDGFGATAPGTAFGRGIKLGSGTPTIDVDSGTTCVIIGGINSTSINYISGPLTKTGAGTLTLSGANYSAGGLTVNNGTLNVTATSNGATVATVTPQAMFMNTAVTFASGTNVISMPAGKGLAAGQMVTGAGIPAGTTITSITDTTATLSNSTTAANSGIYFSYLNSTSATFASGSTSIIVGSATNVQIGQAVVGTGIPVGAVVTGISGTTVTLNLPTTAAGVSSLNEYAFGGADQYVLSSTTGVRLGIDASIGGNNGLITGLYGNVMTIAGVNYNSTMIPVTNKGFAAFDSLGNGPVTVNGGTLDLGGLVHRTTKAAVNINGGTLQNGTITGNAFYANVPAATTATVSNTAVLAGLVPLTKSGAGTLNLNGANTYSAGTILQSGLLNVNNSTALGTSSIMINGGSLGNTSGTDITLSYGNNAYMNGDFTYEGTGNKLAFGTNYSYLTNNVQITVNYSSGTADANTLAFNGRLNGAFGITKAGPGTLFLNSDESFSGGVTINAGTVLTGLTGNCLGSYAVAPVVVNGGKLDLNGTTGEFVGSLKITGGIIANGGITMHATNIDAAVASGEAVVSADLYRWGTTPLTKSGAGTLTLSGNNNYNDTLLNAGRLNLNSNSALGSNGRFYIADSTVLGNTSGADHTMGNVQTWNGNFSYEGTGNKLGITGTVTLGTNVAVTVNYSTGTADANALTVGGISSGGYMLTKNGLGTLITNGTLNGNATVNAGKLQINGMGGGNTLTVNGGTVDLNGQTAWLNGTANLALIGGTIQNGYLAITNNDDYTFNVPVQATVSAVMTNQYDGLTSNGAGRLTLTGNNTITHDIHVNNGTVQIYSNANLGAPFDNYGAQYFFPSSGTLWLNGTLQTSATMALDGIGTQSGIYARSVNLGANPSTILVDAGTTLTISGGFNNGYDGARDASGTLTKDGAGTLVLSSANQSCGGLVLNGGTLRANDAD
ncbi:MAG: autotransporter-associated beta strand repeat-containing protein, partial [Phycisphaerae bacterium]